MQKDAESVPALEVGEAARLAASGAMLLLDVREPQEWEAGHAAQAVHLPLGRLADHSSADGRPVIAVCRSGNRSGDATRQLRRAGVDAFNLSGGMLAWAEGGLPIVRTDGTPGCVA